jgi:hypothetical protein
MPAAATRAVGFSASILRQEVASERIVREQFTLGVAGALDYSIGGTKHRLGAHMSGLPPSNVLHAMSTEGTVSAMVVAPSAKGVALQSLGKGASEVVGLRRADPDASRLDGHDRASGEHGAVRVDGRDRGRTLFDGERP